MCNSTAACAPEGPKWSNPSLQNTFFFYYYFFFYPAQLLYFNESSFTGHRKKKKASHLYWVGGVGCVLWLCLHIAWGATLHRMFGCILCVHVGRIRLISSNLRWKPLCFHQLLKNKQPKLQAFQPFFFFLNTKFGSHKPRLTSTWRDCVAYEGRM